MARDQADMEDQIEELQGEVRRLERELRIVDVTCARCDRPFRSLASVKWCTRDCELGYTAVAQ